MISGFEWSIYLMSLYSLLLFSFAGWLISLVRNNITHVDSMWSLFFVLAALTIYFIADHHNARGLLILVLVSVWALRLCAHLTIRNWNEPEDSRYVKIRQNNQPHFWLKSIYIIFGLQAVLAWVISLSLYGAITSHRAVNFLDYAGILVFGIGFYWEVIGDWQLAQFQANLANKGKVLNTGLWRYSRHPNYFGECCLWWGFYLIALAGGAWWAIVSPLLMTLLLLKISGVSLLESTIVERRPAYANYIKNTNAFIPWFSAKK